MKPTLIVSAFHTMGKTTYHNNPNKKLSTMDSDSSNFSWIKDEDGNNTNQRNPNFISDYMDHIKTHIGKVDVIFVSSHKDVRDALVTYELPHVLVYPDTEIDTKRTIMKRLIDRGSPETLVTFIDNNYVKFIMEIEDEIFDTNVKLYRTNIELDSFEYITDSLLLKLREEVPLCQMK